MSRRGDDLCAHLYDPRASASVALVVGVSRPGSARSCVLCESDGGVVALGSLSSLLAPGSHTRGEAATLAPLPAMPSEDGRADEERARAGYRGESGHNS